ncbi:MAG: metallophosphoesterase [Acidobacteria bacterium]|nr:metallophosphoesterase [Acidobacteriota bacterium]
MVFLFVLGLLVSSQLFWFWAARRLVRGRQRRWQRWALGVPLYAWFGYLLVMFVFVFLRWMVRDDAVVLLSLFRLLRAQPLDVAMGVWLTASLFSFVLILVVGGGGWLIGRAWRALRSRRLAGEVSPERRHFLQTATYAAGAVPFVMMGYGFLVSRQDYRVQEVALSLLGLPEGLEGLRLLQLTDVHASAYLPLREVRRIVGLARELEADLVVHTGDFITGLHDPLRETVEELASVRGRYGEFGCLGNHEIYAQAEETATELFQQQGVRILRKEAAELEINGARLNLIGVDYQRQPFRRGGLEQWAPYFLRGVEPLVRRDAFNLLLCHNPNPFVRAAELGIELTLAGHTHGGQVQVEILDRRWSPPRFFTPFISGLYQLPFTGRGSRVTGHALLYVSRGLGTVFAPIRLNAPPEITLLTLRRR